MAGTSSQKTRKQSKTHTLRDRTSQMRQSAAQHWQQQKRQQQREEESACSREMAVAELGSMPRSVSPLRSSPPLCSPLLFSPHLSFPLLSSSAHVRVNKRANVPTQMKEWDRKRERERASVRARNRKTGIRHMGNQVECSSCAFDGLGKLQCYGKHMADLAPCDCAERRSPFKESVLS